MMKIPFFILMLLCPIDEEMLQSNQMAEQWFVSAIRDKGIFHYYYPKTNNKNNALRQLMASRLLAEYASKGRYTKLHEKNMAFILKYWVKTKGSHAYIYYNKKSKLGANAMMLRTLARSPTDYHDLADKFANGILYLINQDGSFRPWYVTPKYKFDPDRLLTFYSGEAILALIEHYKRYGGEKYLEAAIKLQDFYIKRYVYNIDKWYYPAYIPWHTMSMNELFKLTKDKKYAQAIFILNDKLVRELQSGSGRFYNPDTPQYGSPHTSSDGVYTEGLAYALEVAIMTGDPVRHSVYAGAIKRSFQHIRTLQDIEGYFVTRKDSTQTRIDCTQHIIDAYHKILRIYKK